LTQGHTVEAYFSRPGKINTTPARRDPYRRLPPPRYRGYLFFLLPEYDGPRQPIKLPLPLGGSESNTWFVGPTRDGPQNGISIGSIVSPGLTNATNRQTDRLTDTLTDQSRYPVCSNTLLSLAIAGYRCYTLKNLPRNVVFFPVN